MTQLRCAGSFERLVLLAIERLQELSYGMMIRREIGARTCRCISVGAVYVTLMRMEAKGWIRSVRRPARMREWSRARRFYVVEAPGRRAVRTVLRDADQLRAGLPGLGNVQPPPVGATKGMRPFRPRSVLCWPEEPSLVKRWRTPRDPNPPGRWADVGLRLPPSRDWTGPWEPWVRYWLLGLRELGPLVAFMGRGRASG